MIFFIFFSPSNENGSEELKATQSFCLLREVLFPERKKISIPPFTGTQGCLKHHITFQKQFYQKCDGLQAKAYIYPDYRIILLMGGTYVHPTLLYVTTQASVTLVNQTSPPHGSMHMEPEVCQSDVLLWTRCPGEKHGTYARWKPRVAKFLQDTVKQSFYNHTSSRQPTRKSPRKL